MLDNNNGGSEMWDGRNVQGSHSGIALMTLWRFGLSREEVQEQEENQGGNRNGQPANAGLTGKWPLNQCLSICVCACVCVCVRVCVCVCVTYWQQYCLLVAHVLHSDFSFTFLQYNIWLNFDRRTQEVSYFI